MVNKHLSHHGIDGQKWGKRNGPPYPLDSEGKKRFREQKKKLWNAAGNVRRNNTNYKAYKEYRDMKVANDHPLQNLANTMVLISNKELNDSIDEYEKIAKDFVREYGDKKLKQLQPLAFIGENAITEAERLVKEKHTNEEMSKNISEIKKYNKQAEKILSDYNNNDKEYQTRAGILDSILSSRENIGEIANSVFGFTKEDADQGYHNSYGLYLEENNKRKEALSLTSKANKITYSFDDINSDDDINIWLLKEGLDSGWSETDNFKSKSNLSKNLFNKVSNWDYLNQAVKELGMDNINYKDLTKSDWQIINSKIKSIQGNKRRKS